MRISYDLRNRLPGDIFGGVTATVIALPVALGFGVASGLGPIAGIYSAIAVGFFAAVFGGTPSQISGPTGPMTIAMAVVLIQHAGGDLTKAFTIVMLAGLFQIALGILRIGSFVTYTPYSVISGFMSGIGVIVMTIQVLPFLGANSVPGGPINSIRAWPEAIANLNYHALIVGLIALLAGIFWPNRLSKYLPGPLVALILGTVAAIFFFTNAPIIGKVPTGLPEFFIPEITPGFLASALQPAFILALLGSIDSLLTSLVADSITRTRHNPNRELMGQGLGNFVAGIVGALPGAGATMGTVVNIRAGGRTPVSGALRSIVLLALVLGLGQIAEPIPHAVLAGILIKVGWDIIDWRFVTRVRHVPREYLVVMLMTLLLTVFVDLVTAVALGLIASAVMRARQSEQLELDSVVSVPLLDQTFLSDPDADEDEFDMFQARAGLLAFRGHFSVASANELVRVVSADIHEHEVVIFDFSDTTHMDDSAALIMEQLISSAGDEDTECIVMNLSGSVASSLNSFNVFKDIPDDRFVDNLEEARELVRDILDD
ncbi:MAG: SulP family inorganic anion transporter [Dehalococcoidia bacterium]|nr:SulP family inorganic anion transporter [Dehalococcoidia bacterium]